MMTQQQENESVDLDQVEKDNSKEKYLIDNLKLEKGDIVALRFEKECPIDEWYSFYRILEEKFPDNIIMAMPQDYSLEKMTKKDLSTLIDKIQKMRSML